MRDNPLAKNLARRSPTRSSYFGQGLAPVETGVGTLIGFSTQPGNVASDGVGRNSPYAGALLKHMESVNTDIAVVMMQVRIQVLQETRNRQVPWEHSSLTRPFSFRRADSVAPAPAPPPAVASPQRAPSSDEATAWTATMHTTSVAVLDAFLKRYPVGIYADMARARIQELRQATAPANPPHLPRPAPKEAPAPKAASVSPAPSRTDMTARISAWIGRDYLEDRVAYAAMVDWYDRGLIGREAVLQDRAAYLARWPQRTFALVPGTIQISSSGPSRYVATFELTYLVSSELRNAKSSGRSRIMVDLELIDGQLLVTRQKEIISR